VLLDVLAPLAGRTLAKALRTLAGPWWLAQSDPYPDCARSASAAFKSVFPGPKHREALLFCRGQVRKNVLSDLVSSHQRSGCAARQTRRIIAVPSSWHAWSV
jgi:hypothetical protein